jgi:hypothetical protein
LQIEELERKHATGDALNAEQLEKIALASTLRKRIAELKAL